MVLCGESKMRSDVSNVCRLNKVAAKIIDMNKIKMDYVFHHLYREAVCLSKLNHPCIVALYETLQGPNNLYYLMMELATGVDLGDLIRMQHTGQLEEKRAKTFTRQFASALAHMHNLGVVHRDLKLENVMLNSLHTQIKIVDFGLSSIWSYDSPLKTHCGSPEYAAPELFLANTQYGPEVDMWSLGIIVYAMVNGHLPFQEKSYIVSAQPRRQQLIADISRGLSENQKRLISHFTLDFQSCLLGLLNIDSNRRLNVKELLQHAWITENGKKVILTNPLLSLTHSRQAKILKDISNMTKIDLNQVIQFIKEDSLSKVAVMYRILAHRHKLKELKGDGVSRLATSHDGDCNNLEEIRKNGEVNNKDPKKLPSLKGIDYRQYQSVTMRRKAYSATLNRKHIKKNQIELKASTAGPHKKSNNNTVYGLGALNRRNSNKINELIEVAVFRPEASRPPTRKKEHQETAVPQNTKSNHKSKGSDVELYRKSYDKPMVIRPGSRKKSDGPKRSDAKTIQKKSKDHRPATCIPVKSSQLEEEKSFDYRNIQSTTLRRMAYSATVKNKNQRKARKSCAVENLKRDGKDTYVHKTLKRKTTEIHDPLPDSKQRINARQHSPAANNHRSNTIPVRKLSSGNEALKIISREAVIARAQLRYYQEGSDKEKHTDSDQKRIKSKQGFSVTKAQRRLGVSLKRNAKEGAFGKGRLKGKCFIENQERSTNNKKQRSLEDAQRAKSRQLFSGTKVPRSKIPSRKNNMTETLKCDSKDTFISQTHLKMKTSIENKEVMSIKNKQSFTICSDIPKRLKSRKLYSGTKNVRSSRKHCVKGLEAALRYIRQTPTKSNSSQEIGACGEGATTQTSSKT
ncbi:serine/threonine-protein kinase MARK1 isoform X2 [Aethina tumida]|uniref:serine/threonine-protein kinase MARK1 isoform X2 n=1 Tax=Aethina tumida TaxID=116153 RepID=UPI002147D307|nr:serine/threonine-protein kinase MARK1 isoform X2 [Aethina tumida]